MGHKTGLIYGPDEIIKMSKLLIWFLRPNRKAKILIRISRPFIALGAGLTLGSLSKHGYISERFKWVLLSVIIVGLILWAWSDNDFD